MTDNSPQPVPPRSARAAGLATDRIDLPPIRGARRRRPRRITWRGILILFLPWFAVPIVIVGVGLIWKGIA